MRTSDRVLASTVLVTALLAAPAVAWIREFPEEGSTAQAVADVAIGGDDAIYVALEVSPSTVAAKLDPDGRVLWTYAPPAGLVTMSGRVIGLDPSGDAIVVSCCDDSQNGLVTKLDPATGAVVWEATLPDKPFPSWLRVDADGNLILGTTVTIVPFTNDFRVWKLSGVDGSELWSYTLSSGDDVLVSDGAVTSSGDVVALGTLQNATSLVDEGVAVRLAAATGAELWKVSFDGAGATLQDLALGVGLTSTEDVIVAGRLTQADESTRAYVARLVGATGAEVWNVEPLVPASGESSGVDFSFQSPLAVDSNDDVIFSGYRTVGCCTTVGYLQKLDGGSGAVVWESSPEDGTTVVVDQFDDVVVAGQRGFSGIVFRLTAAKISGTTGARLWRTSAIGDDPIPDARTKVVAVDSFGNAIIGGQVIDGKTSVDPVVMKVDDRLAGSRLLVKDREGSPDKRRVIYKSKDLRIGAVVEGDPEDPAVAGATLTLLNPGTSESAVMSLPAAGWTTLQAKQQHMYVDKTLANGPCQKVIIRGGKKIIAKCRGAGIPFTLDEASQGTLALTLQVVGGMRYCSVFTPASVGRDQGTPLTGAGVFLAKNASPPASCP